MLSLDQIALRAVRGAVPPQLNASVLTDEEKMRLERERQAFEASDSNGALGLEGVLEQARDALIMSNRRRAAVREHAKQDRSHLKVLAARAEKAKRKKMKKRGH